MESITGVLATLFTSISLVLPIPMGQPVSEPEISPQVAQLQQFLDAKKSPLPANELVKYSNWRMIVALSAAESGYAKKLAGTYNGWGIKDFRTGSPKFGKTRDFASWEESIKYTAELLYKYDTNDGSPEPRAMVARWKYTLPHDHWVNNVAYSLQDIDKSVAT